MGFERVYTYEYYDGPRSGFAEYSGKPHYYQCEWNEGENDYADTFIVTPIDDETLSLALEQWAIWEEWERKFRRREVPQSTYPGMPGQHQRYGELEAILDKRIPKSSVRGKQARATFRVGATGDYEVEWEILS